MESLKVYLNTNRFLDKSDWDISSDSLLLYVTRSVVYSTLADQDVTKIDFDLDKLAEVWEKKTRIEAGVF